MDILLTERAEVYTSTLMSFVISKLLLIGWNDWFQIFLGVNDNAGESQHVI